MNTLLFKILERPLHEYISEQKCGGDPLDPTDFISQALCIRYDRQSSAIRFLDAINCPNISDELREEEIDKHVRSLLNGHLKELESSILSGQVVGNDRYYSCTSQILIFYFNIVKPLLETTHIALIFGSDEIGLGPKIKKKYVVPSNVKEIFMKNQAKIPHFSAMLSHNCIGEALPPFVNTGQM